MPDTPRTIFLRAAAAAKRGDLRIEGESGGTGGGSLVTGDENQRRAQAMEIARREAELVMCKLRMVDLPDAGMLTELDDMEDFYGGPTAATATSSSPSSSP